MAKNIIYIIKKGVYYGKAVYNYGNKKKSVGVTALKRKNFRTRIKHKCFKAN